MKAIIVSGYFNPLHKGHLEYLNHAKAIADKLIVIVNNDHQRELKGSKAFQDEEERVIIISNLKAVDEVVLSIDQDRTVCPQLDTFQKNLVKIMIWLLLMEETKVTKPSRRFLFVKN